MRDVRGRPVRPTAVEPAAKGKESDPKAKPEDQAGSGKVGAGHVTEKPGASYGRKRH